MVFLMMLKFFLVYSFIKLFATCEFMGPGEDGANYVTDNVDGENSVLDSVYDTMRNNYETKLRQNLAKWNLISEIRNKRNINEPMSMTPMMNPNQNSNDFYKNHQYEVNRKNPVNFPLGFNSPSRLAPMASPINTASPRSDYEYEEYHKCQEKPTVQTFHIADHNEHDKQHHLSDISSVLFTGLKYLLGGFAILALPFIVLKALFFPLKIFLLFKALAAVKSFFLFSLFLRFLRLNRRLAFGRPPRPNRPFIGVPGKTQDKLQTIKDILNSGELVEDEDYKSEDDEVISKESSGAPMYLNNVFNNSEVSGEFVENLAKLIKLKNKTW